MKQVMAPLPEENLQPYRHLLRSLASISLGHLWLNGTAVQRNAGDAYSLDKQCEQFPGASTVIED